MKEPQLVIQLIHHQSLKIQIYLKVILLTLFILIIQLLPDDLMAPSTQSKEPSLDYFDQQRPYDENETFYEIIFC